MLAGAFNLAFGLWGENLFPFPFNLFPITAFFHYLESFVSLLGFISTCVNLW
jgi:hypothetical protein